MRPWIYKVLGPIRRRQRLQTAWTGAAAGWLVAAVLGIVLGALRGLAGLQIETPALALLLLGPVLGAAIGLILRRPWTDSAHAVDRRYQLKDRAITALDFLRRPRLTPAQELQVSDAQQHLAEVRPRDVVPWTLPRLVPYALAASVAAAVLLFVPFAGARRVEASPISPLPAILAQAEAIAEDLKALDELAKQEQDPELEKLIEELKQKVEEMQQPGVDVREALAKLSEMQSAIAKQQARYNVGLVDGQLKALGTALTASDPLEAAGKALQEGQFEKAAQVLEEIETPELERRDAKALEEKLKQVAEEMGEAGLGQLGEIVGELSEGLKGGKGAHFKKGSKMLAGEVKNHAKRKKITEILDIEIDQLEECKGECDSDKAARFRMPMKSNSSTNNAGAAISGLTEGQATNLAGKRKQADVSGNPGEGPSEMETTHSPEGRQAAARGLKGSYSSYRKKAEAALSTEPIPLGHRQTIRRYFELIRPGAGSESATPTEPANP